MVLTTPESIIEQASTVTLLDDLIDESVRTSARKPIIMQFDPSSGWIWRRWKGTVFSETWKSCIYNMAYALIIYFIYSSYPALKDYLNGFGTLWGQMLSITTFTLTFFVNQSYALWRKCTSLSRRLQGRLHDIGMNLASHAARKNPTDPKEASTYTAASRQILELMSRYVRLFNLLTYASFTRSHRPILTPRGMRRLVERGLLTPQEREVLVDAAIPATQRHSAILMWMIRLFHEGLASGHIRGDAGFEQQTMEKFHVIRAQYGGIGDELQGRMPLAYAHIVQVLVDVILWLYPIMSFSTGMSPLLVVTGTGILTISYQGLFDLAKQFLDPYDNETYGKGEDPLCVDTLIAETNAGSVRWLYGFEEMPFSAQKLQDGELYEYLLPVRGYSAEEVALMEEEKLKREKALEEERLREEEERIRQEEEEKAVAESADANNIESTFNGELNATMGELSDFNTTISADDADASNGISSETSVEDASDARTIHKVTTLASGKPVSLGIVSSANEFPEKPNYAVGEYLNSLSRAAEEEAAKNDVDSVASPDRDVVEPGLIQEVPAPNGSEDQDLRALVEVQVEGGDIAGEPTTYEKEISAEVEATTEKETLQAMEILNGKPQAARDDDQVRVLDEEETQKETTISESRPDGISQQRESTEDDTAAVLENRVEADRLDDRDVSNAKQLEEIVPPNLKVPSDSEVVGSQEIEGISELGSNQVEDIDNHSIKEIKDEKGVPTSEDSVAEPKLDSVGSLQQAERVPDIKEDAPSQSLASEKLNEDNAQVEKPPMTLEEYNQEVSKIMEKVEEEMLETEAILMSKPGYDPLGWDYDDKQLAPMKNATEAEEEEDVPIVPDVEAVENLDILGMDEDEQDDDCVLVADEEMETSGSVPIQVEDQPSTVAQETTGQALGRTSTDLDRSSDGADELLLSTADDSINKDTEQATTVELVAEAKLSMDSAAEDPAVESDAQEAKPTDKIEPIMLDDIDSQEVAIETGDSDEMSFVTDDNSSNKDSALEPTEISDQDELAGLEKLSMEDTAEETAIASDGQEAKPTDKIEPILLESIGSEDDAVKSEDSLGEIRTDGVDLVEKEGIQK